METIIRAKGGTHQKEVSVDDVQVPDLWRLAMWLQDADGDRTMQCPDTGKPDIDSGLKAGADMVLECWYLCHDLLRTVKES